MSYYLDLLSLKEELREKASKDLANVYAPGLMSNVDKSNLDSIIASLPNFATKSDILELKKPEMIITSSNGWMFKNGEVDTTLTIKVISGSEDITDMFNDSNFHWSRDTWDKEADMKWNSLRKRGKSIDISREDIVRGSATTFNCDLIQNNKTILSTRKG